MALGIKRGIGQLASTLSLLSQNERHGMQEILFELSSTQLSTVLSSFVYTKLISL
jgi:hypothetical protein